jgi:hypothetical protein
MNGMRADHLAIVETFLNMILIPALYLKFANVDARIKHEKPLLQDNATVIGD